MGRASTAKKVREGTPAAAAERPPLPQRRVVLSDDGTTPWWHLAAAASIVVLTAIIYGPSLSGEFVFDDHNAILQSLLVRQILPLSRFITFSNRPLVDFSYALNYAQGEYDTWWFHATNIAIHAATAVVLYFLASRTLRLPAVAGRYAAWSQPLAWVAAALFACHPLASETVAYIASRSEGLAGFFYLSTLLLYSFGVSARTGAPRRAAQLAVLAGTLFAVTSKEIAATIPLAVLLYDYLFVAGCDWRSTRNRLGMIAPAFVPLLVGGAYVVYRVFLSGQHITPYQQSAGFGFDLFTPLQYAATQCGVLLHYLRLLVVPTGLTMDYDWPLARTPWTFAVLGALLLLAALAVAAVRLRHSRPFFSFAVLFFFLVLAPTSSIMPLADLAVERRAYIPLAGFAMLAATAGADLARKLADRRGVQVLAATAVAVVVVFSAMTHARAAQWGNHLVLYEDAVRKAPGSPRVRLNLGVVHLNAGRYEEAHDVLFEAKRIYDEGKSIHAFPRIGAFIYYNLGAIQFIREEHDDSLEYMRRAIEIGGQYVALRPRAYAVIAEIYKLREQYAAAEEAFEEALKYTRDHPEWMLSLAEVQLAQDLTEEARKTLFRLQHNHPEMKETEYFQDLSQRIAQRNRQLRRAANQARSGAGAGAQTPRQNSANMPE